MKEVRVRFAPSPTGALHIGGVRTALYNYLLAKKLQGTMILRIEDTDQSRYVPGAEEYIIEALAWVGIKIDEGVGVGGPHAPYRQSERKAIYKEYAQQLINSGHAYYAFDTAEELDVMRKASSAFQYDSVTRVQLKNSLTLSEKEVKDKISSGGPYVIRMKMPANEEIRLNDLIRGEVIFNSSQVDDKVLMKSDGMPTYHLANVVDDYRMKISHVIRGEEWLPSAPLHVMLYKFLGWETEMPLFAHLPLLLKPDGNGKLSKRDADKMGFPIFPITWKDPATGEIAVGYREAGYLPDALVNFLAFLGWNPGTERELFTMTELAEEFTLERIGKAGAKFDILKAQWFNQQYLRNRPDAVLSGFLMDDLRKENISCTPERALKIVTMMKERVTFPQDFLLQGKFFFNAPASYDEQSTTKKWTADAVSVLKAFSIQLKALNNLNAGLAKDLLEKSADGLSVKLGQVMQPMRIALTGQASGPDLMLTMEILGAKEVVKRLEQAVSVIPVKVA